MENKNTFQRILWTIAGAEIPILPVGGINLS